MKKLIPCILISVFCLWTSLEAGEIYEWIDKNGVKHFTNEPPPPGAKIVNKQKAIPYNQAADKKRTQEGQKALDTTLNQQESQTDQQAGSQQINQGVQTDYADSDADDADEGVIVDPYVRRREQVRQTERREENMEDLRTPPPDRRRLHERIR